MYSEKRDEGPQDIIYSPAPGNKTEKTFTFALNLNALQGAFTFGSMHEANFVYDVYVYNFLYWHSEWRY